MASFTQEQEAFIEKVAYAAAKHILKTHVDTCPWGRKLTRAFWLALGIGIGSGMLGATALINALS